FSSMLLLLLLPSVVFSSFCGQQAVPFTFQALKSGQPVLGCARPRCFGVGTTNGTGEPAQFYRIHGKEDGYMKKSEGEKGGRNEMAACSMSFSSSSCGIGQWVGGIAPQADVKSKSQLRCCAYGPLLQSEDRGIATVKPGQLVVGGEVIDGGRVVAFDYVADLAKTVKADGSVEYNVALRRMSCFDEPIGSSSVSDIIGEPSDLSLQQVTEKPVPYSPWANPPPQRFAHPPPPPPPPHHPRPTPGQPRGLQPEPLEGNPTVARVVTPPPRVVPAAPPQYPQQTTEQLQQQQLAAQQTAALAYLNPHMNPMMAQLQQQQQQLAKQQQELIVAQQQLLSAQQQQQQQQTAAPAPKGVDGPLGGQSAMRPLLPMNALGQP
ncbi:hypothetical protein PENTCL1PPCAC_26395, partial [Pristionchus entomophagus]